MPRRYPAEVRRQMIELARSGTRVKQLAATFQVSEGAIYNWLKQDRIDRGEAESATDALCAASRALGDQSNVRRRSLIRTMRCSASVGDRVNPRRS